jgi:hypothetical protein
VREYEVLGTRVGRAMRADAGTRVRARIDDAALG